MKCPYCGSEDLKAYVLMLLKMEPEDMHELKKTTLRKKTTEIVAKYTEKDTIVCMDCGRTLYPADNIKISLGIAEKAPEDEEIVPYKRIDERWNTL